MISKNVLLRMVYLYVIPYLLLLMITLGLIYMYPKPNLHILLNSYHLDGLDFFFKYFTLMAEWPLYIIALLPLFWKKGKITAFFAL